jgi:hypothetical protein
LQPVTCIGQVRHAYHSNASHEWHADVQMPTVLYTFGSHEIKRHKSLSAECLSAVSLFVVGSSPAGPSPAGVSQAEYGRSETHCVSLRPSHCDSTFNHQLGVVSSMPRRVMVVATCTLHIRITVRVCLSVKNRL